MRDRSGREKEVVGVEMVLISCNGIGVMQF